MVSKELTITEGAMPASFEELSGMAKAFVSSGMFKDTTAISQGIVKIQAGKELGIPPVYAMQNINMIKGKLCTSANTMALLIKRSGRYNYRITEHNDTVCNIKFLEFEDNKWIEVGQSQFTIEDAKRAKLVYPDSAWIKYPRAMLFSRAISQGARLYTPDAIGGVYTSEEIKSFDGPVDNEPEPTPVPVAEKTAEELPTDGQIAQAEKDAAGMWPPDPKHAAKAAVKPKVQPVAEPTKDEMTEDITLIGQTDSLPIGKPGMKLRVIETNEVLEWVQVDAKSGRWNNLGVKPRREHKSKNPPDEAVPTTIAEFMAWLQKHGRKFGPTWFYKTFSSYTPDGMKDEATVAKAYAEVKVIQGW